MARLCDVAPTGESLLVTRDLFNLTHRAGHDRAVPLVPGEAVTAEFPLKVIAHRFDAGHRDPAGGVHHLLAVDVAASRAGDAGPELRAGQLP